MLFSSEKLPERLFLLGMPAVGKSTFGKKIATNWGYEFCDLDEEISKQTGETIAELFLSLGEIGFRKLERNVLQEVGIPKNRVISTGGGTPCFFDNMRFIQECKGVSLWMDVNLDLLPPRILQDGATRPMFKGLTESEILVKLHAVYEQRKGYYGQADLRIFAT